MAPKTPEVGQRIIVRIVGQRDPVEALVRAIFSDTEGTKVIVDFGHEQVATVSLQDVVES